MLATSAPFPQFFDKDGSPLDSGSLYFGVANQNPETNPITVYWDALGTQPIAQPVRTLNGVVVRNGTPAIVYAAGNYSLNVRDQRGRLLFYASDSASYSNDLLVQTQLAQLISDLSNSVDPLKGDAMIASKRILLGGALATTIHAINEYRRIDPVIDFGVPTDGVTDCTPTIQAMITSLAAAGVSADIVFPPHDYKCLAPASETGDPRSYASAVIWRGLKNCRIRGMKGTRFIQGPGSAGAPEYSLFRAEMCTNVEWCHFDADGSGINTQGIGAARSNFMYVCNHDLDTKADLAYPNTGIHVHHIGLNNFGGGVCSATRTEAGFPYPLVTKGVSVHDIVGTNINGQNHFVSMTYTEAIWCKNNDIKNPLTLTAQIGNYMFDMSAGAVNALIENNYGIGFTGGAKAETHTGAGVANNEDRISQNAVFFNNTFEQIGDPITLIFPGAGGGAFAGIKLNGINHKALHNTITGRTTNVSTGGLYQGIYLTSTAVNLVETKLVAHDNDVKSTVIGINHDSPLDTLHRFACDITNNKVRDTFIPATPIAGNDGTGIIASRNALVRGNDIYRTARSAILLQTPDQTFVRENYAYDCASSNNPTIAAKVVYAQSGGGAVGYFEFVDNVISDSRGGTAAAYGYFFEAGTTYTNSYGFVPGRTSGLLTGIAFDKYLAAQGRTYSISGSLTLPREFYSTGIPSGTAPWNALAWRVGDRALIQTPVVGSPKAWVCTVAGTPGTWVSEGNL